MGIFLDSASVSEARRAMALGWVGGITTNPTLMARAEGDPATIIRRLGEVSPGPVFYQVTGSSLAAREDEGRRFHALDPDKVVLKIPASTENMALVVRLSPEVPCALTAVYSGAQAWVGCEAGARYVIPYVSRATRLQGDGLGLVTEIAQVLDACESEAEMLAASIKTPEEAIATLLAGARHLTLPLELILRLADHPLSEAAVAEFNRAGRD
ncbi:transaldolase [candidate division WOR-3 bacterium]|nr:transaldolase [candidate division WOR-3 bacterium]